jgi:hypothetical protein
VHPDEETAHRWTFWVRSRTTFNITTTDRQPQPHHLLHFVSHPSTSTISAGDMAYDPTRAASTISTRPQKSAPDVWPCHVTPLFPSPSRASPPLPARTTTIEISPSVLDVWGYHFSCSFKSSESNSTLRRARYCTNETYDLGLLAVHPDEGQCTQNVVGSSGCTLG